MRQIAAALLFCPSLAFADASVPAPRPSADWKPRCASLIEKASDDLARTDELFRQSLVSQYGVRAAPKMVVRDDGVIYWMEFYRADQLHYSLSISRDDFRRASTGWQEHAKNDALGLWRVANGRTASVMVSTSSGESRTKIAAAFQHAAEACLVMR